MRTPRNTLLAEFNYDISDIVDRFIRYSLTPALFLALPYLDDAVQPPQREIESSISLNCNDRCFSSVQALSMSFTHVRASSIGSSGLSGDMPLKVNGFGHNTLAREAVIGFLPLEGFPCK
jgi:hypothetical protein